MGLEEQNQHRMMQKVTAGTTRAILILLFAVGFAVNLVISFLMK